MLKIKNITKSFGTITALDNISLNIEKGEFFGLLGPNGAGKTTLINTIIGYLEPELGEVSIDGEVITVENTQLRKKIGYVPQDISLYLELSAYQNLKIFGSIFNLSGNELETKITEVMELVQLSDRKKDKVKDFSGGMKRRINLAVSLLHDPKIILCDEPTVGVDPQSRNAIFEMLHNLNKTGKTILYTTHYMEEAERLCSRLAIIDNGKIIAQGTLVDLINMLEQKETIKIQKTAFTQDHIKLINDMGIISEHDFYYELIVNDKYKQHSKTFIRLEEEGINNEFVQVSRATLEDVFLNLTGRSLRD
ncbi:MAG: ABC transporter ATP-binding protein [Melioribacteraceae bacterium]|nr:ABC transporter ATP-binding protein [Melioribacteraceae bacterium]